MRRFLFLSVLSLTSTAFAQGLVVKNLPHQGDILFERSFEDKSGSNVVFASAVNHEAENRSDLYVYQYRLENGAPKLVWDIKDFGGALCDMAIIEESVQILDLDGDGFRECSFIYQQRCDGLDPYVTKLMLHSLGKKYAIRGKVAVEDGAQIEKTIDAAFDNAPAVFKKFASAEWDDLIQNSTPTAQKSIYETGNGWAVMAHEDLMTSGGITFSLLDQTGKAAPLPKNINEALLTAEDVSATPDKNAVLILSISGGAGIYEPRTGKFTSLMTFLGDTEALSRMEWSPSKKKVAFVSLNQAQYPQKTKIFVLSLDGYTLASKNKYDAPVFYMAAADWVVYSAEFVNETTLKFNTKDREGGEGPEQQLKID